MIPNRTPAPISIYEWLINLISDFLVILDIAVVLSSIDLLMTITSLITNMVKASAMMAGVVNPSTRKIEVVSEVMKVACDDGNPPYPSRILSLIFLCFDTSVISLIASAITHVITIINIILNSLCMEAFKIQYFINYLPHHISSYELHINSRFSKHF
jgi:hypothetical protein